MRVEPGTVLVDDTALHDEAAGSGHRVVLAHAGIADRRMWDGAFQALAEHFRVVRYDARGFGESAPGTQPFSHRQDLHALLEHLGCARAHLAGCSMGGGTILDYALEHPEGVSALVLVASGPSGYEPQGEPPALWNAMAEAYRASDLARAAGLELQIWVDGPRRTPDQVDPARCGPVWAR